MISFRDFIQINEIFSVSTATPTRNKEMTQELRLGMDRSRFNSVNVHDVQTASGIVHILTFRHNGAWEMHFVDEFLSHSSINHSQNASRFSLIVGASLRILDHQLGRNPFRFQAESLERIKVYEKVLVFLNKKYKWEYEIKYTGLEASASNPSEKYHTIHMKHRPKNMFNEILSNRH